MSTNVQKNVALAPYTTFGVGGFATYFVQIESEDQLLEALEFAAKESLPIFVLGGGSNVLVSDAGFDGLVIKNEIRSFQIHEQGAFAFITYGSGDVWDEFVEYATSEGLSGIELLSGIPGTVGAAPVQNIGAYGTSIDRVLESVRVYDKEEKKFQTLSKDQCLFSYRSSIFKQTGKDRHIITAVTLRLSKEPPRLPSYPDLKAYFQEASHPTLQEIRDAVIDIRAKKGMVIQASYESYKSAGSFFQNPVISKEDFAKLGALPCHAPWSWDFEGGKVKVSAACLIQQAGFEKGHRTGNVGLSPRHTLAILNYGGASAREIKDFATLISKTVQERFAVSLDPEVQFIGKF